MYLGKIELVLSVSARKFYLRAKVTPEDFFLGANIFRKGDNR